MPKFKNSRGFVDPFSLFAVLFLITSLITATAVTNNPIKKQIQAIFASGIPNRFEARDAAEEAATAARNVKTADQKAEKAGTDTTPTSGYTIDQIRKAADVGVLNRTGYDCLAAKKGNCAPGVDVSGFYSVKQADGSLKYYPVAESAGGPTKEDLAYITQNKTAASVTVDQPKAATNADCGVGFIAEEEICRNPVTGEVTPYKNILFYQVAIGHTDPKGAVKKLCDADKAAGNGNYICDTESGLGEYGMVQLQKADPVLLQRARDTIEATFKSQNPTVVTPVKPNPESLTNADACTSNAYQWDSTKHSCSSTVGLGGGLIPAPATTSTTSFTIKCTNNSCPAGYQINKTASSCNCIATLRPVTPPVSVANPTVYACDTIKCPAGTVRSSLYGGFCECNTPAVPEKSCTSAREFACEKLARFCQVNSQGNAECVEPSTLLTKVSNSCNAGAKLTGPTATSYKVCLDGTKLLDVECPPGMSFSKTSLTCLDDSNVKIPAGKACSLANPNKCTAGTNCDKASLTCKSPVEAALPVAVEPAATTPSLTFTPFLQTDPSLAGKTIPNSYNLSWLQWGCAPSTYGNILNEFMGKNFSQVEAAQDIPQAYWNRQNPGMGSLTVSELLKKKGLKVEPFTGSNQFGLAGKYLGPNEGLLIGAKFKGEGDSKPIDHVAYFDSNKLVNGVYEYNLVNSYDKWGTNFKCVADSDNSFACTSSEGKHLRIDTSKNVANLYIFGI